MWSLITRFPFSAFIAISLILRVLSFFYSVIDHDESTYLVIADQLLEGKQLYVDVWDTKPVGIFVIFAGILAVFGKSIVAIRLVAALVVAVTAYLLYRVKLRLGAQPATALFSGLLYIILISSYRFGMAVNTELFFNVAIMTGFMVFVYRKRAVYGLLAGIIWGCGFLIKYVVLFDVMAILLAFFVFDVLLHRRSTLLKTAWLYLLTGTGLLLPFVLCNLYFYVTGTYDEFYEATFKVPGRYKSEVGIADAMQFILKFHLKFLPVMLLFYRACFMKMSKKDAVLLHKLLPVLWFCMAWIPVILPGKYFDHYFAQLVLPVSWLAAEVIYLQGKRAAFFINHRKWIIGGLTVVIPALIYGNQAYFYIKPDIAREVANDLENRLEGHETIYAGKKLQVLYFLLDTDPPTKYVHPTLLTFASHIRTLKIYPDKEFEHILEKQPQYVVYAAPHPNKYFDRQVSLHYKPLKKYSKGVVLYQRIDTGQR